jgi:hypothetical protein
MGKFRVKDQWIGEHHRSGWGYALGCLDQLTSVSGVVHFDGIVDKKFAFGTDPGDRRNNYTAYHEPWVGFLHNPPRVP